MCNIDMRRPRGQTQTEEIHENGNEKDPTEVGQEEQQDRRVDDPPSQAVRSRPCLAASEKWPHEICGAAKAGSPAIFCTREIVHLLERIP